MSSLLDGFVREAAVVLFAVLLVGAWSCGESSSAKAPGAKAAGGDSAGAGFHYQFAAVKKAPLEQTVKLPAQLAAFQQVSIFPKVNGYVRDVLVDIGSRVKKGQLLMVLEAPELEQASVQAREKYTRSHSDYTISRENYQRLKLASETAGAVSPMALASALEKADADSAISNSEKANWQMQQTILGYLRVMAPFDGVITERNVHPGALVSAEAKDGKPMLELRQVSKLRLQIDIPEGIAAGLKDRDTVRFFLSAFPGKKMLAQVSRKSSFVNVQYRSERVELDVYNHDGSLAPGMYADVLFTAKGNPEAYTVPKSAVVTSTERKYVLCVRDGKTEKVDVESGNELGDKIEVIGAFQAGDVVIVHANDEIKEGVAVK